MTRLPLRYGLPLLLAGALGLVALVTWRVAARDAESHARRDLGAHSRALGSMIAAAVTSAYRQGDAPDARSAVERAGGDRSLETALLLDPTNRVVHAQPFRFDGSPLAETPYGPFAPIVEDARRGRAAIQEVSQDGRVLVSAFPVRLRRGASDLVPLDPGVLLLVHPLEGARADARADALRTTLRHGVASAVLVVVFVWLLRVALLHRLERVRNAARRIAGGDRSARARVRGTDEVADVAAAFDGMADAMEAQHRALARAEERLRQLLAHSSDVIAVVDEQGRIAYVSESVKRVLGSDPKTLVGEAATGLVPPHEAERLRKLLAWTAARPDRPSMEDFRMRDACGGWRDVEVVAVQPNAADALGGTLLDVRDVTERRRTQERLNAAERMELLGRLAGGIAHDFNNLLTVILGWSDALREEPDLPPSVREAADEILSAAEMAQRFSRQLLALGQRQVQAPQRLDLVETLRRIEPVLRSILPDRVALRLELPDEPVWVEMDQGALEQVVLNLVGNARDAIDTQGEVVVTARAADRPIGDDAGVPAGVARAAALEVADDGCGMNEDTRDHIFDPFYTTKPAGRGTGIGLATVREIVGRAGGLIAVESAPGRGSRFHIHLPLAEGVPAPAPPAPHPEERGAGSTILVVEDDPAVRRFMAAALEAAGYRVIQAASGPEAIRLFSAEPEEIALVVSDVGLPGLGGRETVERLRLARPALPAVFVSGHIDDALLRDAARERAVRLLAKPFSASVLREEVRQALAAS